MNGYYRINVILIFVIFSLFISNIKGADMFLFVDGIPGESTSTGHIHWMNIDSFEHYTQSGTAPELSVTQKTLDKSSPLLCLAVNNNQVISDVILDCCLQGTTNVFYRIHLFDATVTDVEVTGNITNSNVGQTVSFNPGRIEWEYTIYDTGGAPVGMVSGCWNVTNNTACP